MQLGYLLSCIDGEGVPWLGPDWFFCAKLDKTNTKPHVLNCAIALVNMFDTQQHPSNNDNPNPFHEEWNSRVKKSGEKGNVRGLFAWNFVNKISIEFHYNFLCEPHDNAILFST